MPFFIEHIDKEGFCIEAEIFLKDEFLVYDNLLRKNKDESIKLNSGRFKKYILDKYNFEENEDYSFAVN
mgnify:CR=1 FL=1